MTQQRTLRTIVLAALTSCLGPGAGVANAQPDEFPPFDTVSEGYERVVSTADGRRSMYTIYRRDKDAQLLAEFPSSFEGQRIFIATSVAGGGPDTGFQWSDRYVYWKQIGKRLALVEPNLAVRSNGDSENQRSIDRTFSDRVILDVPIVTNGPGGGPVIDLDALLLGRSREFFGSYLMGAQTHLARIAKTKAFPQNVEIAFELPRATGQFTTVHYSMSVLPPSNGYTPRKADQRIGYFTTTYRDLGNTDEEGQWVRYINRWRLEKRDPSLKLSPPKEPITFYIEYTTPIRYRRWVREGILAWNKAFEQIGILNAVEVYYQDATTGAHMEKDPEDVRYNFLRWTTADLGFAMGPSRVDPTTGEILDADIIMDESWISHYVYMYDRFVSELTEKAFSPATLAWLERHPKWDPRLAVASPLKRERLLQERALRLARHGGAAPYAHPFHGLDSRTIGDEPFDGLLDRHSQMCGFCESSYMQSVDIAMLRAMSPALREDIFRLGEDENGDDDGPPPSMLDGLPEEFIGPLIADVITHEVGHTLGLMHNFKASSVYTLEEINSPEWGDKPIVGSIMDYYPLNLNVDTGEIQGNYGMRGIGPYDMWAIEYGYTFEKDLEPILDRVAEPELAYGNDIDVFGPDPLIRQFDLGKDPLNYAESQIRLARMLRGRILDSVEDGDSWEKVRQLYDMTFGLQTRAVTAAVPWIGGVYVHRDRVGDPGDRNPIEIAEVEQQRRALAFIIENAFRDEAFGLEAELLTKMGLDKWFDMGGFSSLLEDDAYPIHARVMGMQSMALTLLMDPYRLARVYDNEFRIPTDEDALTLPEILQTVYDEIWSELNKPVGSGHSARKPMISSLRRNLQHEHVERLIDLARPDGGAGSAGGAISNLAVLQLRQLKEKLDGVLFPAAQARMDPYTLAHLTDAQALVTKALEAQYVYNAGGGGMPLGLGLFLQPTESEDTRD
jgi:hypothetical protein